MTTLAATLHDPDGRMEPLLRRHLPRLGAYATTAIAITPQTSRRVRGLLMEAGVQFAPGGPEVGAARADSVRLALDTVEDDVLCIDFDRWLFWAETEPAELLALPARLLKQSPALWYAIIGRTRRAFETHPRVQRVCEAATNRALSLAAGRTLDAVAGCCWLTPAGARYILARTTERTNATDLEWPALVLRAAPERLGFVRTEGLAFETASFYQAEIAAAGSERAWLNAVYEQPAMWATRLRLAAGSASALERVLRDVDAAFNAAESSASD